MLFFARLESNMLRWCHEQCALRQATVIVYRQQGDISSHEGQEMESDVWNNGERDYLGPRHGPSRCRSCRAIGLASHQPFLTFGKRRLSRLALLFCFPL